MRLRRIFLRRMPGIKPGFEVDALSPGINVVVGPNGSGKTSLRRAVADTLWPRRNRDRSLEIESTWDDGGRALDAVRELGKVDWRADGEAAEAPALPDEHLAACYTLGVGDLLAAGDDTDKSVAERIRVAMSGGYDLRSVLDKRFMLKTRQGHSERNAFKDAQTAARGVLREQVDLALQEQRLGELEAQAKDAAEAGRELERIDAALALFEARRKLGATESGLAELASGISKVSRNDGELLDSLESRLKQADDRVATLEGTVAKACAAIEQSGLDGTTLSRADLDAAVEHHRTLAQVERDLADARRREEGATEKLQVASGLLAGGEAGGEPAPAAAVPEVSLETLGRIDEHVRRRDRLRIKREQLEQHRAALDAGAAIEDSATLDTACALLRDWLAAPEPQRRGARTLALLAGIVMAAAGAWLAEQGSPYYLLLAGFGAGVAVLQFFALLRTDEGRIERERCAARLAELYLGEPEDWAAEPVRKMLRDLEVRLAEALAGEQKSREADSLDHQLDGMRLEERALENTNERLRRSLGIDAGGELSLREIAARCRAHAEARVELGEAQAVVAELERRRTDLRRAIQKDLAAAGFVVAEDAVTVGAAVAELERRHQSYTTAAAALEEANSELEETTPQAEAQRVAIEAFYEARDLSGGDRVGLQALLRDLPSYESLSGDRRELARRVEELTLQLADHAELTAADEDDLRARRDEVERRGGRLGELKEEIGGIKKQVRLAGEGDRAEEALARQSAARDALVDACEAAQLVAAGRLLLEQVDAEHEQQSRPAVLDRAMGYFAAFTHNAYELVLADGSADGFRARDTSSRSVLALSELSDGTRMQLLLAVRLAFATSAERGVAVPLMLDEALSTSDPERFGAVAEALAVLAADGRQVFYFTSNPADVVAWKAAAARDTAIELRRVDLAEIRWGQAAVKEIAELALPAAPVVPKPEGLTAEQYGVALGVPPASAHAPIESLHLFHVLRDDLPLLYRMVAEFRLHTVGQWESFSRSGRATTLLPLDVCRRLDALCACAHAAHEAVLIGRGRPVDEQGLEQSDAVTDIFLRVLKAVNIDVGGDPKRLLGVIGDPNDERVKGFRKKNLEKLTEYLQEHGYIDERPVLEVADVYARAIAPVRVAIEGGVIEKHGCMALVDRLMGAFGFAQGERRTTRPADE